MKGQTTNLLLRTFGCFDAAAALVPRLVRLLLFLASLVFVTRTNPKGGVDAWTPGRILGGLGVSAVKAVALVSAEVMVDTFSRLVMVLCNTFVASGHRQTIPLVF